MANLGLLRSLRDLELRSQFQTRDADGVARVYELEGKVPFRVSLRLDDGNLVPVEGGVDAILGEFQSIVERKNPPPTPDPAE